MSASVTVVKITKCVVAGKVREVALK